MNAPTMTIFCEHTTMLLRWCACVVKHTGALRFTAISCCCTCCLQEYSSTHLDLTELGWASRGAVSWMEHARWKGAHLGELDDFDIMLVRVILVPEVVHDQCHWHREDQLNAWFRNWSPHELSLIHISEPTRPY